MSVVLPLPLGASRPVTLPRGMAQLRSCSTRRLPRTTTRCSTSIALVIRCSLIQRLMNSTIDEIWPQGNLLFSRVLREPPHDEGRGTNLTVRPPPIEGLCGGGLLQGQHALQEVLVLPERDAQRLGVGVLGLPARVELLVLLVEGLGEILDGGGHDLRGAFDGLARVVDEAGLGLAVLAAVLGGALSAQDDDAGFDDVTGAEGTRGEQFSLVVFLLV